uniref:BMP and activin membrane-bound inhibitor homolog isoform X2 n=1 Tax=Myxine glutinosa TaxID=7769 RepID=UPI00358EE151
MRAKVQSEEGSEQQPYRPVAVFGLQISAGWWRVALLSDPPREVTTKSWLRTEMEWRSLSLVLQLCVLCVSFAAGDIRCYCDAPVCVPTGYMCKSPAAGCFSRPLRPSDPRSPRTHGCVEGLRAGPQACRSQKQTNHTEPWPLLSCCQEDMCNYHVLQGPTNSGKESAANVHTDDEQIKGHDGIQSDTRELWFRAAVIAVPVAGALVLILLIGLALRLLRSEARRQRRVLGKLRCLKTQPTGLVKTHMCPTCDGLGCSCPIYQTPGWPVRKPSAWSLGFWGLQGDTVKVAFV